MKTKKHLSVLLAVIMVAALLVSCGSAPVKESAYARAEEAYDVEAPAYIEEDALSSASAAAGDVSIKLPQGRKWIVTVSMNTETEDLDAMLSALNRKIGELQGYIENQDIRNGSSYNSRRYRNADLTVRIPVEKLTDFTSAVAGMANVVSNSQSAQDVTLNYVDTESRLAALKIEEERLLEMLSSADTMSDMLEIESRLTDIRYEVERYGSKLRTMDNQIDFATIHLSVEEVKEYTPVVEKTYLEKITEGFITSLKDLGSGIAYFVMLLIIALPYLVVLGAVISVIVILIRRSARKRRQRRIAQAKETAAAQQAAALEAAARYAQAQAAAKAAADSETPDDQN